MCTTITDPNSPTNFVAGVTSASTRSSRPSAAPGASACSAATCSRVLGSRERRRRPTMRSVAASRTQRRPQPVDPSAAELEQRVDAEASPGPAGDARDAAAAHEVVEVRDGGDELHALDDVLGLGLHLVERRAPFGGGCRRQHDERFGARGRRGVDHAHAVAELTGGDRRRLVRAAHAGRDREDEDAVVAEARLDGLLELARRGADVETRSSPSSSLSGRSPSRTDSPPIVSHIGTTVIRCLATSSAGRAAALSVTMATVTAPAAVRVRPSRWRRPAVPSTGARPVTVRAGRSAARSRRRAGRRRGRRRRPPGRAPP